ncbi:hypothetical protein PIIN_06836 [Serendipita indica DSM 11827]|uniref:C2H2-type domain-containing protein n=1 Tax=Serendipita indica (strain DSM 11827) TaxID=1109443 RepID=G4TNJ1_SERID|nr:hypothetical protein PIIN_06836 [Serendipita indica DSM 11827]
MEHLHLPGYPYDILADSSWQSFYTSSESGLTTSTVPPTSPESFGFGNRSFEDAGSYFSSGQYDPPSTDSQSQEDFVAQFTNNLSVSSPLAPISAPSGQPTELCLAANYNGIQQNNSVFVPALEALLPPFCQSDLHTLDISQPLDADSHGPKRGACQRSISTLCSCEGLSIQDIMNLELQKYQGSSRARVNTKDCRLKVLRRFPPERREHLAKIMADPDAFSDIPPDLVTSSLRPGVNGKPVRVFKCTCCPNAKSPLPSRMQAEDHIKTHLGVRQHKCPACGVGRTRKQDLIIHKRTCESYKKLVASTPPLHQPFGGANAS